METFSALLALCKGSTGHQDSHHKKASNTELYVFFDLLWMVEQKS